MKKTAYLTRATKRFLDGTNCKSPIQAVEQGVKTLSDWIETLSLEQEFEAEQVESNRSKRKTSKEQGAAKQDVARQGAASSAPT